MVVVSLTEIHQNIQLSIEQNSFIKKHRSKVSQIQCVSNAQRHVVDENCDYVNVSSLTRINRDRGRNRLPKRRKKRKEAQGNQVNTISEVSSDSFLCRTCQLNQGHLIQGNSSIDHLRRANLFRKALFIFSMISSPSSFDSKEI